MSKSSTPTLREFHEMLQAHAREIAGLRAAIDVQFARMAQMQAELDVLPTARERRRQIRTLIAPLSEANGNGRSHR